MSDKSGDPPTSLRRGSKRFLLFRSVAWVLILGATGYIVHAEVRRPEFPDGVRATTDLVYRRSAGRRLRLDVYEPAVPPLPGGRPAVVAIHGGGWRGGSKDGYGRRAARLAQHGYVVVAVDYTLSRPGAPSWPANLEDVREAVRWVRRHADEYGIDRGRVVALGASAGGHLAALLGTDPAADRAAQVQAVIDFYGPSDLAALVQARPPTAESVALLLGASPADAPDLYAAASPAHQASPGDPPMLLLHGTNDALVPLEQSRALASALDRAGVKNRLIVVAGARHGFEFSTAEKGDLLPDILAFLANVWKASRVPSLDAH